MVTMEAFQDPHLEEIGWENFLGMTVTRQWCGLHRILILNIRTLS